MARTQSVLDACCGGKMMWFEKDNPCVLFMDRRRESLKMKDITHKNGEQHLEVTPDIIADFTDMPFQDNAFSLVVFDPPHLKHAGEKSWMVAIYGKLTGDWKDHLRLGFSECWRVLKPEGTLVFKWSEIQIPVSQILPLAPAQPLFGNRCGKTNKLHWLVFHKPSQ